MYPSRPLRIVHVFRAPLGGLFRHVVDLATEQSARGHQIGLFFDRGGDSERVRAVLKRIPALELGVATAPIHRNPHPTDFLAYRAFSRYLRAALPDVVHGHGSKGGVYARLAQAPARAYTPHGGSFNYRPGSVMHRAYMTVERALAPRTEAFLFESDHIRLKYDRFVGFPRGVQRVVVNGLSEAEFETVQPVADAADYFYVGELRQAKGIDTLLDALAILKSRRGAAPRTVLFGSGPDREALAEQAARLDLSEAVRFAGPAPIRQAFAQGRVMVVPSRYESMPYVVLEAAAAAVPLVATNVGGVPEIFGPFSNRLGPPNDPALLADRMAEEISRTPDERARRGEELAAFIRSRFSIADMAEAVLSSYRDALSGRPLAFIPPPQSASGARIASEA